MRRSNDIEEARRQVQRELLSLIQLLLLNLLEQGNDATVLDRITSKVPAWLSSNRSGNTENLESIAYYTQTLLLLVKDPRIGLLIFKPVLYSFRRIIYATTSIMTESERHHLADGFSRFSSIILDAISEKDLKTRGRRAIEALSLISRGIDISAKALKG